MIDLFELWDATSKSFFAGIEINPGFLSPHPRSVPAGAYFYALDRHGYHQGEFISTYDLFLSGSVCIDGVCMYGSQ
jgi:hypothetical protein